MDSKKLFRKNDEAVSPVIGVILMVAITVILAAAIGSSVFSHGTAKSAPQANFNIRGINDNATPISLYIEHVGGDPVHFEDDSVTKVMTSVNGGTSVQIKSAGTGTGCLETMSAGDVKTLQLIRKDTNAVIKDNDNTNVASGDTVNIKFVDAQTNQMICDKDVKF